MADVALRAAAPGDYVIEVGTIETTGEVRVVTGIRASLKTLRRCSFDTERKLPYPALVRRGSS